MRPSDARNAHEICCGIRQMCIRDRVNAGYEHNTGVVIVETFQTRGINPVHVDRKSVV